MDKRSGFKSSHAVARKMISW